jgi:putative pyruvate formate lyase activating enzyme
MILCYFNINSKLIYIRSKDIEGMFIQVGGSFLIYGMMKKGIIIRHLMLPGLLFDSKKIVDYIYNTFRDSVFTSLMNQYTPIFNTSRCPEINKKINPKHYEALVDYCVKLGISNAYIQEQGTASESFIPNFDLRGI